MSSIQKLYVSLFCTLVILFMGNIYFHNNLFEKFFVIVAFLIILYLSVVYRFNFYLKFYLLFYLLLFFVGLIRTNYFPYLLFDLFSFSAPFLMQLRKGFNLSRFYSIILPRIGIFINTIGLILALNHVYHFGLFFGSIDLGRGIDDPDVIIMSPKTYLYLSFFIYPLSIYIKGYKQLLVYNLSFILFIIFSLAMASRGTTMVGVLVLILVNFFKVKTKLDFKFILKFLKYSFFLIFLFIFLNKIPVINASINLLEYRFFEETDTLGSERTEEAIEILSNLSTNEFVFGKGFGAANKYWIFENTPNGVNNVHFGWLFIVLKGGIVFLFFLYGSFIISFFKMVNNEFLRPYAFILLTFLLMEFIHQQTSNFMIMVFVYISSIAGFEKEKSNVSLMRAQNLF